MMTSLPGCTCQAELVVHFGCAFSWMQMENRKSMSEILRSLTSLICVEYGKKLNRFNAFWISYQLSLYTGWVSSNAAFTKIKISHGKIQFLC